MTEDISKNTLLVLVVLTIVVSLLGTWTVINEASKVRVGAAAETPAGERGQQAEVSLDISNPQVPPSATGQVTLNIEPERGR